MYSAQLSVLPYKWNVGIKTRANDTPGLMCICICAGAVSVCIVNETHSFCARFGYLKTFHLMLKIWSRVYNTMDTKSWINFKKVLLNIKFDKAFRINDGGGSTFIIFACFVHTKYWRRTNFNRLHRKIFQSSNFI